VPPFPTALCLILSLPIPGFRARTSSPGYFCVLRASPLLGENETMNFYDSPHCIAPSPLASPFAFLTGLSFRNVFCSERHLNCSLFLDFEPSFRKFVFRHRIPPPPIFR
jgi:hypothetical protein